jgi:hypothetical protein
MTWSFIGPRPDARRVGLCLCLQDACRIDDQIAAAKEIGVRLHACRGSMSLGDPKGGLPPDDCVEDEKAILTDCVRAIETYHDVSRAAMTRLVLGPCSPFR